MLRKQLSRLRKLFLYIAQRIGKNLYNYLKVSVRVGNEVKTKTVAYLGKEPMGKNALETKIAQIPKSKMEEMKQELKNEIIDTDANIGWIPDAIERRAYLTMYKTVLEILEKMANTTKIELLNHILTIKIEPKTDYQV